MDPHCAKPCRVRGDVDAITGFTFTSLLNIEARGVKAEDVVIMQYRVLWRDRCTAMPSLHHPNSSKKIQLH
jgi:hypothetical protein